MGEATNERKVNLKKTSGEKKGGKKEKDKEVEGERDG